MSWSLSLIEGSQGRKSGQEHGGRSSAETSEEVCLLACSPCFSQLAFLLNLTLPYQAVIKKLPYCGQPDAGIFSIKFPSSQITLAHDNTDKISNQDMKPCSDRVTFMWIFPFQKGCWQNTHYIDKCSIHSSLVGGSLTFFGKWLVPLVMFLKDNLNEFPVWRHFQKLSAVHLTLVWPLDDGYWVPWTDEKKIFSLLGKEMNEIIRWQKNVSCGVFCL